MFNQERLTKAYAVATHLGRFGRRILSVTLNAAHSNVLAAIAAVRVAWTETQVDAKPVVEATSEKSSDASSEEELKCTCESNYIKSRNEILPFPGQRIVSAQFYCPQHFPKDDTISVEPIDALSVEEVEPKLDGESLGSWPDPEKESEEVKEAMRKAAAEDKEETPKDKPSVRFGALIERDQMLAPLSWHQPPNMSRFGVRDERDGEGKQIFRHGSLNMIISAAA